MPGKTRAQHLATVAWARLFARGGDRFGRRSVPKRQDAARGRASPQDWPGLQGDQLGKGVTLKCRIFGQNGVQRGSIRPQAVTEWDGTIREVTLRPLKKAP